MSKRTQIAVAVVDHEGLILVGRRAVGTALAGMAEFPGGKVLPGETPAEAAARECLEETGLAIRVGTPFPTVEHDYPHGRLQLHFFRSTPADPESANTARAPFRWVSLAELAELDFPPANRAVLQELLKQHAEK